CRSFGPRALAAIARCRHGPMARRGTCRPGSAPCVSAAHVSAAGGSCVAPCALHELPDDLLLPGVRLAGDLHLRVATSYAHLPTPLLAAPLGDGRLEDLGE